MKAALRSFVVPVLLSGAWGVMTYLLGYVFLRNVPMGYLFFYPMLLTGVVVATGAWGRGGVPHSRAALAGCIAGFVYLMVSPVFPLFASVLAGASLGGGLSHGRGRFGGLLSGIISTLKGIIVIPLVVLSGEFLGVLILLYLDSVFLTMVFWGMWLGLGVCLIRFPVYGRRSGRYELRMMPELEEFRAEARDIERDLRELHSGID